jgi:hypothetical protein
VGSHDAVLGEEDLVEKVAERLGRRSACSRFGRPGEPAEVAWQMRLG